MDYDRLDSGMTQDERGTPYSLAEAETLARDESMYPDDYVRGLTKFLLRRVARLERELGELKVERDRSEANAFMASQREMRKIGENNELRERMNNLLAQQKEIIP